MSTLDLDRPPRGSEAPLRALAARLRDEPGLDASLLELETWDARVALVAARRDAASDAPALTVLLGPTGAGKSTLVNALAGRTIARTSALRPCTSRPLALGRADAIARLAVDPFLREWAPDVEWAAEPALPAELADRVLVDTPDFDSVEAAHRLRALPLFERADEILVVLSADKYADRAVLDLLDSLRPLGNVVGAVLNKADGGEAVADATRLLAERGIAAPVVVQRTAPEAALPAFRAALDAILALLPPVTLRPLQRAQRLAAAARDEQTRRARGIAPFVDALERAADDVERALLERREALRDTLSRELPLRVDDALRNELIRTLRAQIERMNPFAPLQRAVDRARAWLRERLPGVAVASAAAPQDTTSWLTAQHGPRFRELHLRDVQGLNALADAARARTSPAYPWNLSVAPDDAQSRTLLQRALLALEPVLRTEADAIAARLPVSVRARFYGSQLAVHALVLGILVKTGGLSGGEIAFEALLGPIAARVVRDVLATGEVESIERRLRDTLASGLADALLPAAAPIESSLARARTLVGSRRGLAEAVNVFERSLDLQTRA